MSWIEELEYEFIYKCGDHSFIAKGKAGPPTAPCPECGEEGQYAGFKPQELRQTTMVEYERNGRKGMAIRNKDGSMTYVSKTKLHYMKTGRIENQYTPAYREHLIKTDQEQMLATEHNRRRASISRVSEKEVLKNMPDGEYISDGTNIIPKEV